jgi:D-alanine-D-alanine ligase
MKIAFTHNLRLTDAEEEAEFDTPETIEAIASALTSGGHEVVKTEVSGPASHLAARLEAFSPDLIFNIAEGRRGRAREAFYPALFEELGYPYTGSDAYALTVTLDKWLTKQVLKSHGVDTPTSRLLTARDLPDAAKVEGILGGSLGVPIPAIVKPNFEGSSKGISDDSIARDWRALRGIVSRALEQYPQGVLVEEFIPGIDITVPFVEGVGPKEAEGVLSPVEFHIDPSARSKYNIYDYRLKNRDGHRVHMRCPAHLSRDVLSRLRALTRTVVRVLNLRDVARIDFRIGEDGRIYFLEVNALPALDPAASLFAATKRENLSFDSTIAAILASAAVRWKLLPSAENKPKGKPPESLRIGFTYNIKRPGSKQLTDADAEYDSPVTIESITQALESMGHAVVPLEANSELPSKLIESKVDLVFNIAEGLSGRNREAQVPALCELCGIPYTGSDAATLALALDKALAKRLLRQHAILTPEFQVMTTGREKMSPRLRFPLIVKPIAEGSSKGILSKCVVDDELSLRKVVREIVECYKQPALVEEYISGREFTVGLLGDRRPRVMPPMEIVFKDRNNTRPVYDYEVKQDWTEHVYYECPAKLTLQELRAVERAARETFQALDCRDVARVDLRMNEQGQVYVLEINPLPGLTPDYSDLVLIAKAAAMDYRTLIAEILAGGLKRLREKRRGAGGMNGTRARSFEGTNPANPVPTLSVGASAASSGTSQDATSDTASSEYGGEIKRPTPSLESQFLMGSPPEKTPSLAKRRRARAEKNAVR